MSDISRDRLDADEDRLPWLEAVEDQDDEPGVGSGKLIAALVAALIAIGLIIGGVFWIRDRGAGQEGDGELIAAPQGPYKTAPAVPGGMEVAGTGDVAYPASEGADVNSTIDLTAIPETPVTEPRAPRTIEPAAPVRTVQLPQSTAAAPVAKALTPKPAPPKTVAAPAPAAAQAVAAGGGGMIQLGAFSSEAKANAAWKSLSGRFSFLGGLGSSVTPVTSGANTLYRLRASGGDAKGVCARLKVAGESCVVVN